jgi:putative NADH-flavin reductase
MNIIIFGASGRTGQELVKQSLEKGHVVTAFVRNPLKMTIADNNLKIYQGDVSDYTKVADAIKGQDAVLSALGAASPFKYDQSVTDGIENVIKAMQESTVRRLIYMSFVGVKETRNTAGFVIKYIAPKLLVTEVTGHENRENMIKQSQLKWTIVHAPTLTNGKHRAQFRSGEGITTSGFTVTISRADVADFMVRQINDNTFVNKVPSVMY